MLVSKKQIFFYFLIGLFLISRPVQARVFMFEEETVAPFLKLRTGVSSIGTTPYRWQSATTYGGDKVDLMYGGEFGVYFRGPRLGLSLGVLVQSFDPVTGGKGFNASGTSLYSVDLSGIAYGPQVTFDYQLSKTEIYLWKLQVGGGYQYAKFDSTYTMTTTGQSLVGGQSQITETYKQEVPYVLLAISTEFKMSGTTTLSITGGYHYSFNKKWNYAGGGLNFAGTHQQGDSVTFEDSSTRPIDWSYPFLQMGFHFYTH